TPIGLHELLYPLVQGWDSVNIHSDVELGATDQTYNNLVGRDLQTSVEQPPQIVMIMPILRGTDGVKKMSKSLGNYIGVADAPTDVFGKTMSIPDELIGEWFTLLTDTPEEEWQAAIAEHPMKAKEQLAKQVGARFHGAAAMNDAATYWHDHFGKKKTAEAVDIAIPAAEIENGKIAAWKLAWYAHGCEPTKSDARRMVQNGAFEFEGAKITDMNAQLDVAEGATFRAGRHRAGPQVKQPLIARVRIG
ncbi:MAG: tyrosine--tRNA ligase, partial [Phycisphaerae bacterium]